MKLAFSTLGCPDWKWDVILATAKDMGYDGVEVRGVGNEIFAPDMPVFRDDKIKETVAKLERLNIKIPCFTTGCFLFDKENGDKVVDDAKKYVDLAAKAGTKYIRLLGDKDTAPSDLVNDTTVFDNLKQICDYASSKGVLPLVETNGVYADSERLLGLVSKIGSDKVGVLWDVHHPYRYFNEAPDKTYSILKDYVKYVHVKDSVIESGKIKYKMMGYGDMPLKEIFSVLNKGNYDGFVSLEWVKRWYSDLEEPGVVFMQFASYMHRIGAI